MTSGMAQADHKRPSELQLSPQQVEALLQTTRQLTAPGKGQLVGSLVAMQRQCRA